MICCVFAQVGICPSKLEIFLYRLGCQFEVFGWVNMRKDWLDRELNELFMSYVFQFLICGSVKKRNCYPCYAAMLHRIVVRSCFQKCGDLHIEEMSIVCVIRQLYNKWMFLTISRPSSKNQYFRQRLYAVDLVSWNLICDNKRCCFHTQKKSNSKISLQRNF